MDHAARKQLLLSSPLFDALPKAALDDILAQAAEKSLRRGQTLYLKGDEGSYMAAVLKGRMRMSANSPDGREVTLNIIDAGEIFGEIALLDGKPRSADATAIEDSELLLVERRHFLPHLTANQDVALHLIGVLCQRLRETSETLGNFAMLDLPGRLARKLLNLAAGYGRPARGHVLLDIRLSHTDLGRFVGCSRESVNKQMRAWEEQGIVARQGSRIVLCDRARLKRIGGED